MTTAFPASLDTFVNPNAAAGDTLSSIPHDAQHANINDSVKAIETKLGVNSSAVTTTIDYLLKNPASLDPGHKHSTSSLTGLGAAAFEALGSAIIDDGSGNLTIKSGAVTNAMLVNSSITLSGHSVSLGGTLSLVSSDVGLGGVTNDAQTKAAIVPNTVPTTGQILAGNAGGTAYAPVSMSGDATLASTGSITFATVNSNTGSFGSATKSLTATVTAKGLITAISEQTITPAIGSVTGLGTGTATALGVNTGSAGAFVVNGGALGTPTSGTLANCTGLPVSTGISGLGTGIATFLASPSSANLASAVTDETGSGKLVFATSPTFSTSINLDSAAVFTGINEGGVTQGFALRANTVSNRSAFRVIPNGTIALAPTSFEFFGTDYSADSTNYERLQVLAKGSSNTAYVIRTNAAGTGVVQPLQISTGANAGIFINAAGNPKIGGTADRATTEGTNHLDIFNGTAPVGTLANGISLYSTAGELRVMDAAGNATLLSPHDKKDNAWIYDSVDTTTGKHLRIDMEKMMKFLNKHFGTDFVHEFMETA